MSHLDEGTLHALLDGELGLAEVSEIQGHLGSCVACGARLQEVKQFLAEADRLVGALKMPEGSPDRAARTIPAQERSGRKSPPSLAGPFHEPDPWEPPVILLPEATDSLAGRRRLFRAFRWAAMIAVIVGGGRWLFGTLRPGSTLPSARDITMAARPTPPAVASPQETTRPDSTLAMAKNKSRPPAAPTRALADKTTTRSKPETKEPVVDNAIDTLRAAADSASIGEADSAPATGETLAVAGAAESVAADSVPGDNKARDNDPAVDRTAAAAALAQLDLQRRRERAAAATAALPPARPDVQAAAEPPPAPRTPEQRAQIYLRIGLDEAGKQLGGPLHVIEGMSPQLIGLVQGRLMPGADPNRPVVRVVYLDTRGRMILLDQQRMRPGQAPGAAQGNLRWNIGDVMVYLRGEPSVDVLRSLQGRVR